MIDGDLRCSVRKLEGRSGFRTHEYESEVL